MSDIITQEQRENLEALRDELRERVPLENFEMEWLFSEMRGGNFLWEPPTSLDELHKCGTAACALGTAQLMPRFVEYLDERDEIDEHEAFGLSDCVRVYEYLFDGAWHDYDNTPTGAADRIDYYLEHGEAGPLPWESEE